MFKATDEATSSRSAAATNKEETKRYIFMLTYLCSLEKACQKVSQGYKYKYINMHMRMCAGT